MGNIFKGPVRILTPAEYEQLLTGIPGRDHQTLIQTMFLTGMRYMEIVRLKDNPRWFEGEFIHLPEEAVLKAERKQLDRYVHLNALGRQILPFFLRMDLKIPCWVTMSTNMKRWAEKAKLLPKGLSVKSSRKTWESWLMSAYPEKLVAIVQSQGHLDTVAIRNYVNLPFTAKEREDIKKITIGWE